MKFVIVDKEQIRKVCQRATKKELIEFLGFFDEFVDFRTRYKKYAIKLQSPSKRVTAAKEHFLNLFSLLLMNHEFKENCFQKLAKTELSKYLYDNLVWQSNFLSTKEFSAKYSYQFTKYKTRWYGDETEKLQNNIFADNVSLINRKVAYRYNEIESDILFVNPAIKELLKLVMPIPQNYYLHVASEMQACEYHYNNEEGALLFVDTIYPMLQNNLVAFGATKVKPLAKSLNILKQTSGIQEFYSDRKLHTIATDMLTRSFTNYYWQNGHKFEQLPYNSIKHFILAQFSGHFDFMISRIFLSHLKKVRYDNYYQSETDLFSVIKLIVSKMPEDNYISMQNILDFCKYRDIEIDIDVSSKRNDYTMECDILTTEGMVSDTLHVGDYYRLLMFEPLLKASFFYLGALGLMELEYEEPHSPYTITAKNSVYISHWDGLKYIKLTELGKYVFGLREDYAYQKSEKKVSKIKFDAYKPIITVDKSDIITQAKLEQFADKYDENRYILSYAKIFRDVKSKKQLDLKIDAFYKKIEAKPPQVFKDFFDDILNNANLLKRDLKQVVIELGNNKKLLNLFMQNRKLQELIIKAEGYRVIVLKENISKLTKIVKDNGFFVEF